MGKALFFIFMIVLCPTLSLSKTVSIYGTFNGQIDKYCIKTLDNVSNLEIDIYSNKTNCMTFIASSGVVGNSCKRHSYLYVSGLSDNIVYYRLEAQSKNISTVQDYELYVTGRNFEVGLCPDEALARATGMRGEDLNLSLAIGGLFVGLIFFGSITHVFLNFKG